ncbi:MAG: nucleoside recognition domain-containing protein, partial [Kiritimatiellia bacterium]
PPETLASVSVEEAEALAHPLALERSYAGRIGRAIEPVIEPLGYDWQIGIGILSSFAAREAIISGLSIVYGIGESGAENADVLMENLRQATRTDGTPVFTVATCLSLLVFYVLAMQCLPTQAVTRAETGSWKWAGFQLLYMSVLAYTASLLVYQGLQLFGVH